MSETTAVRKPRQRKKQKDRTARVLMTLSDGALLVEVTDGELLSHYYVTSLPGDFGRAFRWEKFACQGGEVYAVNVGDRDNPASCECKGHLRWGHRTVCRHVACSRALIKAGK